MTEPEVKLLGVRSSPYVMRPMIALNLKGVKYEFLEEIYGNKSDLLLESNPIYKKIPVLIHMGKPVCESMIIVEYVDEIWDVPDIVPSDPYDRAVARFWAAYIDDKWHPSLRAVRAAQTEEAKTEAITQVFAGLQLLETAFKECSKGKDFFGGDAIGYLDIAFGCFLGWLGATEKLSGVSLLDVAKTPLLAAWAKRFRSHAALKELIPEIDELVGIVMFLRASGHYTK